MFMAQIKINSVSCHFANKLHCLLSSCVSSNWDNLVSEDAYVNCCLCPTKSLDASNETKIHILPQCISILVCYCIKYLNDQSVENIKRKQKWKWQQTDSTKGQLPFCLNRKYTHKIWMPRWCHGHTIVIDLKAAIIYPLMKSFFFE